MCDNDDFAGYIVYLHAPGEAITSSTLSFHVPYMQAVSISIKPKLTETSVGLRQYTPEQRRCLYNWESKLDFFKIYTQRNCEAECVASFVLKNCGCVKFSMPRERNTKICGTANIDCYVEKELVLFGNGVEYADVDENATVHRKSCNCLPACYSVSYHAEIDRMNVKLKKPIRFGQTTVYVGDEGHLTLLSIFFRDQNLEKVTRMVRKEHFEFLSDCGGLLGGLMGISVLSIFEIIYYSTLRLFWTCRRWNCNKQLGTIQAATASRELTFDGDSISIDIPYSD